MAFTPVHINELINFNLFFARERAFTLNLKIQIFSDFIILKRGGSRTISHGVAPLQHFFPVRKSVRASMQIALPFTTLDCLMLSSRNRGKAVAGK